MFPKDILVSVDASEIGRERLRFGIKVARAFEARLTAYYTTATAGTLAEGSPAEIAETIEGEFWSMLDGLSGAWVLSGSPATRDIVERIRVVDLAILGLGDPERDRPDPQGFDIDEVVQGAGRPVLGVPVSRPPESFVSRALVAWDGSRESARALHDALPFLVRAQAVEVLSLGPNGPDLAREAVEHLARHGIAARPAVVSPQAADIGTELLNYAAVMEADLVVAGAYGHSRLMEAIFGGASRSLLRQMLVPILMSH